VRIKEKISQYENSPKKYDTKYLKNKEENMHVDSGN